MEENAEAATRRSYVLVREAVNSSERIVVLHIGANQTGIAVGRRVEPDDAFLLSVGTHQIAREYFKAYPPRPIELENAIAAVEDAVMTRRTLSSEGVLLFSTDPVLGEIAILAGCHQRMPTTLSLEAIEHVFDRLASIAMGRPMSQDNLPENTSFAAGLLILREFMHHQQFAEITVLP